MLQQSSVGVGLGVGLDDVEDSSFEGGVSKKGVIFIVNRHAGHCVFLNSFTYWIIQVLHAVQLHVLQIMISDLFLDVSIRLFFKLFFSSVAYSFK